MNDITVKVLILEAAVLALARTHPDRDKLFHAYAQIFPDMARALNKTDSDHSGLGKQFAAKANAFGLRLK